MSSWRKGNRRPVTYCNLFQLIFIQIVTAVRYINEKSLALYASNYGHNIKERCLSTRNPPPNEQQHSIYQKMKVLPHWNNLEVPTFDGHSFHRSSDLKSPNWRGKTEHCQAERLCRDVSYRLGNHEKFSFVLVFECRFNKMIVTKNKEYVFYIYKSL